MDIRNWVLARRVTKFNIDLGRKSCDMLYKFRQHGRSSSLLRNDRLTGHQNHNHSSDSALPSRRNKIPLKINITQRTP